ncbi:hypothetical protein BDR26DRAFT_996488 [Obelidium mucronatum]|nr:hypothetical protein BDR26DRAFT_996488 [Obelidium mucronatum]
MRHGLYLSVADECPVVASAQVNTRSAHNDVQKLKGLTYVPCDIYSIEATLPFFLVRDEVCPYDILLGQNVIDHLKMKFDHDEDGNYWALLTHPATGEEVRVMVTNADHYDNQYDLTGLTRARAARADLENKSKTGGSMNALVDSQSGDLISYHTVETAATAAAAAANPLPNGFRNCQDDARRSTAEFGPLPSDLELSAGASGDQTSETDAAAADTPPIGRRNRRDHAGSSTAKFGLSPDELEALPVDQPDATVDAAANWPQSDRRERGWTATRYAAAGTGRLRRELEQEGHLESGEAVAEIDSALVVEMSSQLVDMHTMYKPVSRKVVPVAEPLADGSAPVGWGVDGGESGAGLSEERIDLLCSEAGWLSVEEMAELRAVLKAEEKAFSFSVKERGRIKPEFCEPIRINTVPHKAWKFRPRKIPYAQLQQLIDMLKEKLDAGILEPCFGPYAASFFVVPKKDGTIRFIQDLQPLNSVTIRDSGIPPRVDEIVNEYAVLATSGKS